MKFVVVLALILCCAAFANSLKIFKQNGSNTLACCGSGRTFDTTTQICCINTVFSIPDANSNNQAACCGTRLLTNDQICCEAIPGAPSSNDRAIPSSQQCCGTRGYDPATQLCCLGNVISNNNNNLQCCGTRSYNPSNDLCCPDALSTSANVVANGVTNGQSCCGNSGFNPTNQLCCGGRAVSNSNNNLQCCNAALFTTSFDPTSQTCCLGVVNSGGAGLSCCGTRSYNPATSLCCDTTVVNNPNGNLQCCGSRTFDPATQTCCRVDTTTFKSAGTNCAGCKTFTAVVTSQFQVTNIPQSSAQCCGLTAFSTASSQCCNGRINPLVSSTNVPRSCCGTTTYDPTADLCCPTTTAANALPIVGGVGRPNTACCGTTTYNTLTQTCQCGKQVTKTQDINELGGLGACCGTTQYNNISATCCSSSFGNFLYPLQPAAGWKCCPQDGQSLYNPGYQVCCDRKKNCPPNPTKLSIRDVEEVVSIDFRPLKGNFDPRDSHDFAALLEKHARATRSVEEVEQVEQVEQVEEAEEAEDVEDLEKKKKKKKKKSNKKADSRSRTSGNIDNNDKEKFSLVQCGDTCCNGQGFYSHFQRCCGTEFTGYNVIDVSNTDVASSPLACCGNNIYNTQFEGCCTEARSTIDSCGNQKANYGIWKRDIELCCTD